MLVFEINFQEVQHPMGSYHCPNLGTDSCWAHLDAIRCSCLLCLVRIIILNLIFHEMMRSSLWAKKILRHIRLILSGTLPLQRFGYLASPRNIRNNRVSPLVPTGLDWCRLWQNWSIKIWRQSLGGHMNFRRRHSLLYELKAIWEGSLCFYELCSPRN